MSDWNAEKHFEYLTKKVTTVPVSVSTAHKRA
jgi:hypothetical protein